jgi:hypothetical protein
VYSPLSLKKCPKYWNDYLEIINREGLPGNIKNDLCLKVQDLVITTVQHVIEAA